MRRIAVVSDSHDNLESISLFLEHVRQEKPEAVIHAGDIISPFALRMFAGAKMYGVYGNNDGEKLLLKRTADELGIILEEQPLFFKVEPFSIAVIHGADGLDKTQKLARALAKSGEYRLVVYGHTHKPDAQHIGETLVLNPGALSGYLAGKRTYAVVDLETLQVDIIEL
jgi:putative phosphoesterase